MFEQKSRRRPLRAPQFAEALEPRRLLAGQLFPGDGPNIALAAAVVSADFNADGKADLATASTTTGVVSVALGDGSGGFAAATSYPVAAARALTAGDFNGDGKIDLAVTSNTAAGAVSVLLNNGNGTFAAPTTVTTVGTPYGITSGDFNTDGKLDLVTTSAANNIAGISLGNGNGTFAAPTTIAIAGGPQNVVTGDFNNDNKLDFATANNTGGTVSVALGNGLGGYLSTTVATTTVLASPRSLAVADFNGDGKKDLAVGYSAGTSVSILLGSGFGSFAAAPAVTASAPYGVIAGDFNADGKADIAVANFSVTYTISLLSGVGNGTFTATDINAGRPTYALTAADFNGDGRPDLAAVSSSTVYPGVAVLLASGNGTFVTPLVSTAGTAPIAATIADFNGDGIADYAAADATANTVDIALGNGSGTFAAPTLIGVGSGPTDVVSGDFNRDGKIDLAVANYNGSTGTTVSILYGAGNGSFAAPLTVTIGTGTGPYAMTTTDLNKDGITDIAVTADSNAVYLIYGSTSGTPLVQSAALPASTNAGGIAAGDFNNDGRVDLAVTSIGLNSVVVLTQTTNGGFAVSSTQAVGSSPQAIAVADFNADGNLDLAVGNYGTGTVSILLGSGFGTFAAAPNLTPGTQPAAIVTGDFDGDGKTDLAVASRNGSNLGVVSFYLGAGNGTFATPGSVSAIGNISTGDHSLAVGDFNGDGRLDLLAANGTPSVTTLLNRQTISNAYVSVTNGTVTLTGTGAITVNEANGVLTIVTPGGTVRLIASSIIGYNVTGSPTVTINSDLAKNGGSALTSLTVGTTAVVTSTVSQHLTYLSFLGTFTLAAGGNKVLRVNALSVGPSGHLDLNDNSLIYDYPSGTGLAAAIGSLIGSARNGGSWTGIGLTSTSAKNNAAHSTTLGYIEASDYKSIYGANAAFAGDTIDSTAVLVTYTLYGDADFNRKVDFNDFLRLQNSFGQSGTTFGSGNFNYDNVTDFNDFLALQNNFGQVLTVAAPATNAPVPATPPMNNASISGVAFNDANRNGVYDKGDSLAVGKTVWLDLDNDGVKDANEPSAVTDMQGRYTFKNLAAREYRVRRVFSAGYIESTPARSITLTAGQAAANVYIGSKLK